MPLVDLLLPPACGGCGRVAGGLLCRRCRSRLAVPFGVADRFLAADAGIVLGERLVLGMAAFAYAGPMRRALAALKYLGVARLAPELAELAAPRLADLLAISGPATLVPVPVHPDRLRERGYDQALLLARALGARARLPVCEALRRVRPTTKQHRLNRVARLQNLRGAFAATGPAPPTVIVVDDILTTSATLEACATVLADAGARAVYGFAIAREV